MTRLISAALTAAVYLTCGLYFSTYAQTVTGSMEGRGADQTGAGTSVSYAPRNVQFSLRYIF